MPDRYCSAVLIEEGGRRYLFDAGAPVCELFYREGIPLDTINDIFLTHLHGDHANGLIELIDLMTWYVKTADPLIHLPEMNAAAAIEGWLTVLHGGKLPRYMRYTPVPEGEIFCDGVLKVTPVMTDHLKKKDGSRRPAYAYFIESVADGAVILLSGDMSADLHDFPRAAFEKDTALVVCEGAHSKLSEHAELFAGLRTETLAFTHINPAHNPDGDIEMLRNTLPFKVIKPCDGEIFNVTPRAYGRDN